MRQGGSVLPSTGRHFLLLLHKLLTRQSAEIPICPEDDSLSAQRALPYTLEAFLGLFRSFILTLMEPGPSWGGDQGVIRRSLSTTQPRSCLSCSGISGKSFWNTSCPARIRFTAMQQHEYCSKSARPHLKVVSPFCAASWAPLQSTQSHQIPPPTTSTTLGISPKEPFKQRRFESRGERPTVFQLSNFYFQKCPPTPKQGLSNSTTDQRSTAI